MSFGFDQGDLPANECNLPPPEGCAPASGRNGGVQEEVMTSMNDLAAQFLPWVAIRSRGASVPSIAIEISDRTGHPVPRASCNRQRSAPAGRAPDHGMPRVHRVQFATDAGRLAPP